MYQIVWFKRDLRVCDNRVLARAAEAGPVLPLYIVEPELWKQPDASGRQWQFISECLEDLRKDLARLGQPLVLRIGDAVSVLQNLQSAGLIDALWSHEETGNNFSYRRDQKVAAWCRNYGIVWTELQNHGVIRRLKSRNGWSKRWDLHMGADCAPPPQIAALDIDVGAIPTMESLSIPTDCCPERQAGGRRAAQKLLKSFLSHRGENYRSLMSSPLDGKEACSRLSPYIAWGAISLREINHAVAARRQEINTSGSANQSWRQSLKSYNSRLHWHCHFIQKLEDEPNLETKNLHSGYDDVRPLECNKTLLDAWSAGETGFPFLDACMRFLRATGWLNFRMRAMVTAVASYHLWLHWREPGLEMARLFTDYEPGIHWNQIQMQSGTTGINTIRIYNPVKQGKDQDPAGIFTRRWVPELSKIDDKFLQEPWRAENAPGVIGATYPEPIVDHLLAAKIARKKLWSIRGNTSFRQEANDIQEKHGSRKSGIQPTRRKKTKIPNQLKLPLPSI